MELSNLRPKLLSEVGCNARLKTYPDGTIELLVCDRPIFGLSGWEEVSEKTDREKTSSDESEGHIVRSQRRARQQIKDYALCSDFSFFVTLTLDKEKINRYDISEIVKRLRIWLDNRVRRKGLRYILVPERHKDGAIHFHGFFNDVLNIVESGHSDKNGHVIYNLPDWDFGFTTAIRLYGEYEKAVAYVCKYVGKSSEKIGGRWYYSGGDLKLPRVDFVDCSEEVWSDETACRFNLPDAKLSFVFYRQSPIKEAQ